ncbi:cytochrome c oxidase assembly protein [Pseudoalteromonas sp. Isolate6]|uniref:cytochrome c oxidase assembly protein n=1 Tax=Pseudoalteromonas sp. Isolate6 TaxID=2908527 RepID=UPI001EFDD3F7|nr:cytochrome c oxidase assembly protein [Pseudoalteromonas sp. Isolate6]MCG9761678.1 cytochrome c oxidase assembly protein [Pseudoalteromonas sp. Isolate6]
MQHGRLLRKLILLTLGMFAFAFALVPLYDVFCDVTGLNGKPSMEVARQSESIAQSRQVDVSFTTHSQSQAPFKVDAVEHSVSVQPGKLTDVKFIAKNLSDNERVLQAIPSVSPGKAAKYLHKMACFCFDQQPMKGKEEVEFVLRFYVDTELPIDVEELTLSYTLFDITERVSKQDSDGVSMLAAREEFKYEP